MAAVLFFAVMQHLFYTGLLAAVSALAFLATRQAVNHAQIALIALMATLQLAVRGTPLGFGPEGLVSSLLVHVTVSPGPTARHETLEVVLKSRWWRPTPGSKSFRW